MSSYWTRSKAGKGKKGSRMLRGAMKHSRSQDKEAASSPCPSSRASTNTRTINHSAPHTASVDSSEARIEQDADFPEDAVMADFEDADNAGIILPEDLPEEAEPDYAIEAYCNGFDSDQEMEDAELSPADSHQAAEKSTLDPNTEQLSDTADLGEVDLMQADYVSTSSTSGANSGGSKSGPKRGQKIQPRQTEQGNRSFECPKCSLCFGNELDLNNHINEHNKESKDPNMCNLCSKKLSSASSLERHMLVHSGHRPFKCSMCEMDFTTNGNMHRHMRTHARHAQQQAAAQMAGKAAAQGAMRARAGRGRGGMGRDAQNGARRGRVGRGSSMARWDYPSLVHPQAPSYRPTGGAVVVGGSADHSPQVASGPQQGHLAAVAIPTFSSAPINIHPAFGLQARRVATVAAVVPTVAQGEASAVSELQCPLCKQHFLMENSLDHHLATTHDVNGRCRKCGTIFRHKNDLEIHMQTLHTNEIAKDAAKSSSTDSRNEARSGVHDLVMLPSTDPKEVPKDAAKSPSSDSSNEARSGFHDLIMVPSTDLKFHLYAKGNCEKSPRKGCSFFGNHTCDVCGNAFPTLLTMKMHRREHTVGSMTSCHRCNITFFSREELSLHMRQHSATSCMEQAQRSAQNGEEVKDIMGQEKFFASLGLIPTTESTRVTLAVALAKTQASLCSQQTNTAYFPAINQIAPSGPAVESAEEILARMQRNGLPVSLAASASSALSTSNGVVVANGASARPGSSSSPDSSTEKSFNCKYCEEVFPTKKELAAHVRNHKGVAPYQCDQCSYKSTDKSTLKRHHLTHTGERPHVCKICQNAFTTKANCERHIRKKHNYTEKEDARKYVQSLPRQSTLSDNGTGRSLTSSPENGNRNAATVSETTPCFRCKLCKIGFLSHFLAQKHVERRHNVQTKLVNEMLEICETCKGVTMATDEDSIASSCSTPDFNRMTPQSYGSTPPRAHSTPPGAVHTPPPRAHALGARSFPAAVPFPPPLLQQVKVEPSEDEDSFDNHCQTTSASKEEPMDLTTKSSTSSTPERQAATASATASSASKDKEGQGKSQSQQKQHMLTELRNQLMRNSDQNNNSLQPAMPSPASRAPITMLALQAPLASPPNPYALLSNSSILSDGASPDRSGNYGSDSSSDLASIHRIIDTTNTNFRGFLPSDGDEERGQPSNGRKRPRDDNDDEDDEGMIIDEYEEDEDEMDKDDAETARLLEEACGPGEGNLLSRKGMSQGLRQWRPPTSASNSPDDSNTGSGSTSREGQEPKPKKKRNSYADTPHNLHCDFPGCTRSFPWRSSLNRHMSTHTGDKPHTCDHCDMRFSTKSNRERHLVRKHGVNMCDPAARQTMDRPFKCHICTFSSFATESNLRKHYQERHNGESPPALSRSQDMGAFEGSLLYPPKSVGSNNEESSQMGDQEDKAHSPRSNASRNGLSEAESAMGFDGTHAENHMEEDEEDEEEDEDEDSNGGNGTSESPINPERDNYNVDKITSCWKCKCDFESRKLLLRHLKEHNIDLPFKCYLCDASYDNRRACLRHMQQEHGKPWLQVSRKNGVSSIPQYSMKMDDVVERNCRLSQLLSAGADVSGLQQGEGEAKTGEEGSSSEGVTADYVQRKVYCSFCPKRFWSLQDLRRHMRSHTGERPYECSTCLKRFTLKHSMTRHQTKNRRCGCGSPALSEGSGGDDAGVRPVAEAGTMELPAGITATHSLLLSKLAAKSSPSLHFTPSVPPAAGSSTVTKKGSQANNNNNKKKQKEEEEEDAQASTMLPSLLGMEQDQLDQLLSTSYHDAAKMLGVPNGNPAPEEDEDDDEADPESMQ